MKFSLVKKKSSTKSMFCLKGFSMCSGGSKVVNYEQMPYETNADPKIEKSPETPIRPFLEHPESKQKTCIRKQTARVNLIGDFLTDSQPNEQSTVGISKFPLLIASPEQARKLTSTANDTVDFNEPNVLSNIESNYETQSSFAFVNSTYVSPVQHSKVPSSVFWPVTESTECTQTEPASCYTSYAEPFPGSESLEPTNQVLICCVAYHAQSDQELSLDFAERVRLIGYTSSSTYCLVRNVITNQTGYVPTNCLCHMDTFLNDVKLLTK